MSVNTEEELNRLVHQAIDSRLPGIGVEQRVLEHARERITREPAPRITWMPLGRGVGGAFIALAVIALLGGALGLTLSLRNHSTSTPAKTALPILPTSPPATPPVVVPPTAAPSTALVFTPTAVSFATASDGWTIGQVCNPSTCALAVYRTTDAGTRWMPVHFSAKVDLGNATLNIRAASSADVWIWGASDGHGLLVATHNGGVSWQSMAVGNALVADVELAQGTAWAVTTCSIPKPCTATLFSQPVGGGAWSDLGALPAAVGAPIDNNSTIPLAQLVRIGDDAWILDANQQGPALVRSQNNGRTWMSLPLPCTVGATAILGASSPDHVMLACGNEGAFPAPQEVWTSSDGGSKWILRSREGYNSGFSPPAANVGSIDSGGAPIGLAVLSTTTAWMANDREDDLVTHDGGVTWIHAALPPDSFGGGGGAEGIGFVDSQHGWTFVPGGIWTTSDGGTTWHLLPGITVPAA